MPVNLVQYQLRWPVVLLDHNNHVIVSLSVINIADLDVPRPVHILLIDITDT